METRTLAVPAGDGRREEELLPVFWLDVAAIGDQLSYQRAYRSRSVGATHDGTFDPSKNSIFS